MRRTRRRLTTGASAWMCAIVAILLLSLGSACGGDSGGDNNGGNGDATGDAGDVGIDGADTGTDGDSGGGDTTDPDDQDGDGVDNSEDNCPSTSNADQADIDRDGLGDACDHLPAIHDPENPEQIEVTDEREDEIDNDGVSGAQEYDLNLPFAVEGNVGAVESGQPDYDFYSVSVDGPTALLIHVEAKSGELWPGGVVLGYQLRNGNVSRFMIGAETGEDHYR